MNKLSAPLAAIFAATLALSTTGCQAVESTPAAVASNPADELTDEQRAVAGLAIDALAAELKIPRDGIVVESVTAIDWRDSSLGCPKPGMAYLDVITPGHKVMLSVDGQAYAVHEAKNRAFVCKQAQLAGGLAAGDELEYRRQMLTAQNDLARRLGVPVKEIHPVGGEKRTWEDASLDCPEEGVQYAQVETPGWVLKLRHGERDYTYHADAHHTFPCPAITAE